jgi:NADH dehydrogenase (ubiquinone) Fe-S protein 8
MSFARQRLAFLVASRLRALPRSNPAQSTLIAYRLLSTTSRRSHAEPIHIKHEEQYHPGFKSPTGTATLTAEDEPGKDVNPYKGGPSAIDKAVHLFFFTEIIRGANLVLASISDSTDGDM